MSKGQRLRHVTVCNYIVFMVFGLCFSDFSFLRALKPIQRSRAEFLTVEEGAKLSERSEFLDPPQANAE
jgi:hypothetical protein